jgi:heme-degrading monooxygenase HmoA
MGQEEDHVTIVSLLRIRVRPGAAEELVRAFRELEVFSRSRESGGFLGGRLLTSLSDVDDVLVLAEWESADAYRAWLDNRARAELASRLEPLLADEVTAGSLYEDVT